MLVSIAPPEAQRPAPKPPAPQRKYHGESEALPGWQFVANAFYFTPTDFDSASKIAPHWRISSVHAQRKAQPTSTPPVAHAYMALTHDAIPVEMLSPAALAGFVDFVAHVESLIATERAIVDTPPADVS